MVESLVKRRSRCWSRPRRGFTLVESMVALTLTLMTGSVLLLAVESMISLSEFAIEQKIATGLAQQLVDEALGARYSSPGAGPYQWPLASSSWEAAGAGRERYDDFDDYNGYQESGARDIWGQPFGEGDDQGGLRPEQMRVRPGYFADWRVKMEVYYVSDSDLSVRLAAGVSSNHRALQVTISRDLPGGGTRELTVARRVIAYLPPPPAS